MNLSDIGTIKKLLNADDFSFKKSLGQNFLIDDTVCPRMAEFSVDDETGVLEIGPGIGVLTRALAEKAKRVVTVELDERLRPILAKTLADLENTEVIFGDKILKLFNDLTGAFDVAGTADTYGYFHCFFSFYPYS